MLFDLLCFVAGLVMLSYGGDVLVRYAALLARLFGVRPLIVALTVVAFGTSAPELVACLFAAANPANRAIALGNIVGSNVANICLVMGFCAIIRPLRVCKQTWSHELMILVAVTALFTFLAVDADLGRFDGFVLLAGLGAFTAYCFRVARLRSSEDEAVGQDIEVMVRQDSEKTVDPEAARGTAETVKCFVWIIVGLVLLVVGAKLLIDGAVNIALRFNISKTLIGLTLVAIGTSLPELATSFAAVRRKETDIIVGNVLGSNILNILCVIALIAVLFPIDVPAVVFTRDFAIMGALTLLLIPLLRTGKRLGRREGAFFLLLYAGYIAWLAMTSGVGNP